MSPIIEGPSPGVQGRARWLDRERRRVLTAVLHVSKTDRHDGATPPNADASAKESLILELLVDGGELYGLQLVAASRRRLKRGTVYVTLGRMEEKGYISSRLEDAPRGRRAACRGVSTSRRRSAARVLRGLRRSQSTHLMPEFAQVTRPGDRLRAFAAGWCCPRDDGARDRSADRRSSARAWGGSPTRPDVEKSVDSDRRLVRLPQGHRLLHLGRRARVAPMDG